MTENRTIRPRYRYELKARIINSGFKNLSKFAKEIGSDISVLSRVCAGWELPGPNLQEKIRERLSLSLSEFKNLL